MPESNHGRSWHIIRTMKGNKIILLLLMITVFSLIYEIESKLISYSDAVYERFIADLTFDDEPDTITSAEPQLSSYLPRH